MPWDHRRRNQRNVFSVQSQLLQSECPAGNWDDQEEQWNSCDLLNLEWRTCFKYYKILCRVFLQYAPAQVYFIVLECSANHHTRKHHSTFFWSQILHIYLTVREIKSELYYWRVLLLTSSIFMLPLTVNEMKLTCPGLCQLHPPTTTTTTTTTITLERFGDYVYKKISLAQSHRSGFMPSN